MRTAEVSFDSRAVEQAIARGKKLSLTATHKLRDAMMQIGLKVQARAQERTPVGETSTLKRSARTTGLAITGGYQVEIMFGGLASRYAEVQHENPEFTHTRMAWMARYGLAAGMTMRSSVRTRRTSVHRASGRRFKLRGHKGGQAHFLHGAGDSAWNATAQRWAAGMVERAGQEIVERELGG